ncbi:THIF-type NAD/FAD binding fold-containing protein [Cryptosporidium meleagridis]
MLSEDEVAIYDRQIRLWGSQAQKKLMNSELLILGLSPIHFEFIKNIVLAGIKASIWDNINTRSCDLACNFLLEEEDIGKRRMVCIDKFKEMNPLTKIYTADQNETNAELFCESCLNKTNYTGIVVSLDEEVNMLNAKNISKKFQSKDIFISFSVSIGTRIFLFFNNNTINFDEALEFNIDKLKQILHSVKNLHPYILIIICMLRERYQKAVKNESHSSEIGEILREIRTTPSIDIEKALELEKLFNETWGKTISPIASIGGGLLCQEVTKFCIHGFGEYFCCIFDMEQCEAVTATVKMCHA